MTVRWAQSQPTRFPIFSNFFSFSIFRSIYSTKRKILIHSGGRANGKRHDWNLVYFWLQAGDMKEIKAKQRVYSCHSSWFASYVMWLSGDHQVTVRWMSGDWVQIASFLVPKATRAAKKFLVHQWNSTHCDLIAVLGKARRFQRITTVASGQALLSLLTSPAEIYSMVLLASIRLSSVGRGNPALRHSFSLIDVVMWL